MVDPANGIRKTIGFAAGHPTQVSLSHGVFAVLMPFRLGSMIARVEAVQSWLENVTYQMNQMSHKEQSDKLAG